MIRLVEILRKKVVPRTESKNKVYFQDEDNLYPNRVKYLIENSPTAFRSAKMMSKFITGLGVTDENILNKIIDKTLNLNVDGFSSMLAKSLAYQNGFFVHISYKFDVDSNEFKANYSRVLPFEDVRIGRMDDDGYLGKFYVKNWEERSSFSNKGNDVKEFYSFTRKRDEIMEQIKDNWKKTNKNKPFDLTEAIQSFPGQCYYYNPYFGDIYPLSHIHPVINDCDTEYRIGSYTNGSFRNGMLGKTIVLTDGVVDEDEVDEMLQSFLGDESPSNMLYYPITLGDGRTFEDVIKFIQLKPQYDEKFFEQTLKRLKTNIMACFNNIPEQLISNSERSLFGVNSEAFKEMKQLYSEQCSEEREAIVKFFKDVYDLEIEFVEFGSDMEYNREMKEYVEE